MKGSKLSSPMQAGRGGSIWRGTLDKLALPIDQPGLKQGATPNAAGIQIRTGEVKPESPGGSSTVHSPMTAVAPGLTKRKVK